MIWGEIVGNCCGSLPIGTILSKTVSLNCSCFAPDPTHWYWDGQGQWFLIIEISTNRELENGWNNILAPFNNWNKSVLFSGI